LHKGQEDLSAAKPGGQVLARRLAWQAKGDAVWTDAENYLIVADTFAMLAEGVVRRPYQGSAEL
jgi:hypothetical protein